MSDLFLLFHCVKEISVVDANNVDLDQMPHSAVADLGQHCLLITLLGVSRLNGLTPSRTACIGILKCAFFRIQITDHADCD